MHLTHRALADVPSRHDEGLLAWLSVHSTQWSDDNTATGSVDRDTFTDDIDRIRDAANVALDDLFALPEGSKGEWRIVSIS